MWGIKILCFSRGISTFVYILVSVSFLQLQDKWEEEVKNFQVYKEAAEFEIKDIYRSYNLDLQMEAETQEKLQLDMKFMEKKVCFWDLF